jgi:hypothetical protein
MATRSRLANNPKYLSFGNRHILCWNFETGNNRSTEWSKKYATHIKIFIDGCKLKFDSINEHTLSLWLCKNTHRSRHVVTCSHQSVMSSDSQSARMSFFTSATGVNCRTLPGISFLLNLQQWVYGYISRFFCSKQMDSISSREPFPWAVHFKRHYRISSPGCIKHEE